MYAIALVQNQSEMAHYGYADARSLFADLGYGVRLYTAQNVGQLSSVLAHEAVDGLVLGSNALNDKTIRAYFEAQTTAEHIRAFLDRGGGLLSFHQLRLASMDGATLQFLPDRLGQARPVARPTEETSARGRLVTPPGGEHHIALLYPNRLSPRALEERALGFRSLQGLYWHYWRNPDLADWDVLVADDAADTNRPLVIASKETSSHRVVLSALTLDWQRQREALQNVLAYVVEGRHNTAVVSRSRSESQVLAYCTAALEARRFPFQRYYLTEGLGSFDTHIASGVHTTVVLSDDVSLAALRVASGLPIDEYLTRGSLKVLAMEADASPGTLSGFSIVSRQSEAHRFLALAELAVQAELRVGHVDGSFWSTAETLQVLAALPEVRSDFSPLVHRSLELAREHDRKGSYDEVFGVTCALYWMRATYLGLEHEETLATARWIRDRLQNYDTRERVLAYRTFALSGDLISAEHEALGELLLELPHEDLSEIDLIAYIKAALAAGIPQPLPSLVAQLIAAFQQTQWVDLATTASAASALLDARMVLRSEPTLGGQVKADLDDVIRRAVVSIQDAMAPVVAGTPEAAYPWERKASTTVRCLEAWSKFDKQVALPVYEIIDQLMGWDRVAGEIASTRTSLAVLEELKDENEDLRQDVARLVPRVRNSEVELRRRRLLLIALLVTLYCLGAVLIAASGTTRAGLRPLLDRAFVDSIGLHLAVATLLAGAALIPWTRLLRRLEQA